MLCQSIAFHSKHAGTTGLSSGTYSAEGAIERFYGQRDFQIFILPHHLQPDLRTSEVERTEIVVEGIIVDAEN
jgi:hypothetical protein